jgi:hypothetical protein
MQTRIESKHNFIFWFHLLITVLSWMAPFLVSWPLVWVISGVLLLQFWIFNDCLLNKQHGLDTGDEYTFYSYLFESVGINLPRKPLRIFVRRYLYVILAAVAWLWQAYLGHAPLLF